MIALNFFANFTAKKDEKYFSFTFIAFTSIAKLYFE